MPLLTAIHCSCVSLFFITCRKSDAVDAAVDRALALAGFGGAPGNQVTLVHPPLCLSASLSLCLLPFLPLSHPFSGKLSGIF